MASTYTSELRIEKIATGEQSGTWGTTTNTQYDLWEAAISGTATVAWASDADDTLTTANGSADEARNMFLNFTGGATLTTTRNMVVPTVSKLYFVRNNTTGGQSIVVKTSAGTGITVPTGTYAVLYCDGTNVVRAFNDVTITSGTITGITDLVVADGGTGVSTLTDGGILLGSGAGAITAMAALADGEFVVGDGTTDPVAESGATARTSMGVGTGDSPQFTGVELGHATDTTLTRVSAGVMAVQGQTVGMLAPTQVWVGAQRPTVTALTSTSNSIAIELNDSNDFSHTFTENTQLANPTSVAVAGQKGTIYFTQHASSPKTLAFGSEYDFVGGTAFTVTATNAAKDSIDYAVRADGIIELSGFANWS